MQGAGRKNYGVRRGSRFKVREGKRGNGWMGKGGVWERRWKYVGGGVYVTIIGNDRGRRECYGMVFLRCEYKWKGGKVCGFGGVGDL